MMYSADTNGSQKRRIENEVVFKQRNDSIKDAVKDLSDTAEEADVALDFTCECSNEDCRETINLTIAQYENKRKNSRRFIDKSGHEQKYIERAVVHSGFSVVEKFEEPPVTDGALNKTQDGCVVGDLEDDFLSSSL